MIGYFWLLPGRNSHSFDLIFPPWTHVHELLLKWNFVLTKNALSLLLFFISPSAIWPRLLSAVFLALSYSSARLFSRINSFRRSTWIESLDACVKFSKSAAKIPCKNSFVLTVSYYKIEWYVAWWFTLIFLFIEMGCETQPVISLWKALPISRLFGITAPMELHSLKISLKSSLTCISCNNA